MNLSELRTKSVGDLAQMVRDRDIEGSGAMRKHDLIFALATHESEQNGEICGEGVLEKLPDGYGFLRSSDANYLPGPDDIYVA